MILRKPVFWTVKVLAVVAPERKVNFDAASGALRSWGPLTRACMPVLFLLMLALTKLYAW